MHQIAVIRAIESKFDILLHLQESNDFYLSEKIFFNSSVSRTVPTTAKLK